jgi:hypothetical protein
MECDTDGNVIETQPAQRRFQRVVKFYEIKSTAKFVNCPFQFNKRGQLFVGTHNETLSVAVMGIRNPDCSRFTIRG